MELVDILKMVAPGTQIREGIENILNAKTGGLIVIGYGKEVLNILDGGFYVNVEFTPARLYELAKMDGAIILSEDLKQILYANAQLLPEKSITTNETGTRHRTAERVAKQTGKTVISISQRRGIITIYQKDFKYVLQDTSKVLAKTNQALQTVEKYQQVFSEKINILNEYEFNDIVTLINVVETIQRAEMLMRVADEVQKSIYELGTEGRLLKMQLDELTNGVEDEEKLIIKDYIIKNNDSEKVYQKIRELKNEELMKNQVIANALGYKNLTDNFDDYTVKTRGYRIISKVPRVPSYIVENIIKKYKSLQKILASNIKELDEVDGIGEIRAKTIVQTLRKMQEQFTFDTMIV